LVVSATEQVSPGCIKITASDGPAFFIRTSYLLRVKPEQVIPGSSFEDDDEQDMLDAGLCFAAEIKAVDLLARAEQSHFGLTRKLAAKGMKKEHISRALDYLEIKGYLSDARFAEAWLNQRKAGHFEGRIRLASELAVRGIDRHTAAAALDAFFEDNPEEEICAKAVRKCLDRDMDRDKAVKYLLQHGFTSRMIDTSVNLFENLDKKTS
jgi:regulatory protein